jgi:hypothetical protein
MPKRKPKKIAKKVGKKPKHKDHFRITLHLKVKKAKPGKRVQFKVDKLEVLRDAGPDPGQY